VAGFTLKCVPIGILEPRARALHMIYPFINQ
jgi:hypothetical protein